MVKPEDLCVKMEELLNASGYHDKFKVHYAYQYLDRNVEDDEKCIFVILTPQEGTYRPIKGIQICDVSFTLQIVFPLTDKDAMLKAIGNFQKSIIGSVFSFGELNATFNCDLPSIMELDSAAVKDLSENDGRFHFNGQLLACAVIKIYYALTDFGYFGNQIEYSLNDTVLKVVEPSISNQKEIKTFQGLNEETSSAVVSNNVISETLRFYMDLENPVILDLVINAETGNSQNKVYSLKKSYKRVDGTAIRTFYKDVIIQGAILNLPIGDISTITVSFVRASDVLKAEEE